MYQFTIIDPRNPVVPPNTLGIEVTIPSLAAMCDLGNIDPQHGCQRGPGGSKSFPAVAGTAITEACGWPIPADGATFATIRPDLDAFGAMAVLALEAAAALPKLHPRSDALDRIRDIAAADSNTVTTWTPRALPSAENPWPAGNAVDSRRELAAIAAVIAMHKTAVAYRVAIVAAWLLGGDTPTPEQVHTACMAVLPSLSAAPFDVIDTLAECRARVEAERADMIAALSDGRITIAAVLVDDKRDDNGERLTVGEDGLLWGSYETGRLGPYGSVDYDYRHRQAEPSEIKVAIVRSAHRAATSLGQSVAPLAICFHPAFPWPHGEPTPKATIAWAVPPGAEVVTRVIGALNRAERNAQGEPLRPGEWGGNAMSGIIGSPQGPRKGQSDPGAATLLRAGDATAALDVIANIAPANAARFAEDVAVIKAALKSEWGGNLASGILGSPQGRASMLSEDEIVNIVRETCK
jgi:hypothetical protein